MKTRPLPILLAASLGGCLAGGLSLLARHADGETLERAAATADHGEDALALARLRGRLAALSAEVAGLEADDAPSGPEAAAPTGTPHGMEDRPAADLAELAASAEDARKAELDRLEATFRQQPPGGAWAASAETALRNAARAVETPVAISNAECRGELCRVEVASDDPAPDWFSTFALEAARSTFGGIQIDHGFGPEGRPILVLYMTARHPQTEQ